MEIPCGDKSAKSETSNFGLRFLRFFKMPLQKNVKSRVFFIFKKRKKRILELGGVLYEPNGMIDIGTPNV